MNPTIKTTTRPLTHAPSHAHAYAHANEVLGTLVLYSAIVSGSVREALTIAAGGEA